MITNPNYPAHRETAALIFKEIILEDCYRLKTIKRPVATVVDCGANIGFFSLQARILFPTATIIAIEPCSETRDCLRQNVEHLEVGPIYPHALGKEGRLVLLRNAYSDGCNTFIPGNTVEAVDSHPLSWFIAGEGPYILKLDCEGGEFSILGDPLAEQALRNALHWAMEVHPNLTGLSAAQWETELKRIDPRTTGQPSCGDRWVFWSQQP